MPLGSPQSRRWVADHAPPTAALSVSEPFPADPPPYWSVWNNRPGIYNSELDGSWVVYPLAQFGLTGDDAANINEAMNQASLASLSATGNAGAKVRLASLVYQTFTPVFVLPYTTLQGIRGRIAGGDGQLNGTVIQPQPTWTNVVGASPWFGGGTLPMAGAVMTLDHSVSPLGDFNGFQIADLTVDGGQAPAAVDGFAFYGSDGGHRVSRVAASHMPGNGFSWLGNTGGSGNPDGAHFDSVLAQSNTLAGFNSTPEDASFYDCHAQANGSHGFIVGSNNSFFSLCRADTSTGGNGFEVIGTFGAQDQPNIFVGCGSETNFGHGFHLFRPTTQSRSVASAHVSGHVSQHDGQNGGGGGGGFSGFCAEGLGVRLYIGNAVCSFDGIAPAFGLTARAVVGGGHPGSPAAVKMSMGRLVAGTAASNNEAGIGNYSVNAQVDLT